MPAIRRPHTNSQFLRLAKVPFGAEFVQRPRALFCCYFGLSRRPSRPRWYDPLEFKRLCAFLAGPLALDSRHQLQDVGHLLAMPSLPPTAIGNETDRVGQISVSHGRACDLKRAQNRNSRPRVLQSILNIETFQRYALHPGDGLYCRSGAPERERATAHGRLVAAKAYFALVVINR
jgi:hypothetical protein